VADRYQLPRGTFDVLPDESIARERIERSARRLFARAGYERITTPTFEETELFERGVGRSTDIVQKEMFTFDDKGGRSITLRPEGTAPICRAYVEHGMKKWAQPVRLYYIGSFFRHERPQAGRFRQFNQIGAETIGTGSPLADAELIIMLDELFSRLRVPGVQLRLGSLGSLETRHSYRERLVAYLRRHEAQLSDEVRRRVDLNPLRAFDSDDPGTKRVMQGAPLLVDSLNTDDAAHFHEVCEMLDEAGVHYDIDPTLVRGLDYYTRTVFSFVSPKLGAQSEIGGGGRYDGLIEQLGGDATPAVGWAIGIERVLLAMGRPIRPSRRLVVFVAVVNDRDRRSAFQLAAKLRRANITTQIDLGGRSLKGQLRHAERIGARFIFTVEESGEVSLRNRRTGESREVDLVPFEEEPRALHEYLRDWWARG
jgi:histidyl-tRNA synthetase